MTGENIAPLLYATPLLFTTDDLTTHCPSCGNHSHFAYVGAQHFPERMMRAAHLPTVLHLYTCEACKTTLSHVALNLKRDD